MAKLRDVYPHEHLQFIKSSPSHAAQRQQNCLQNLSYIQVAGYCSMTNCSHCVASDLYSCKRQLMPDVIRTSCRTRYEYKNEASHREAAAPRFASSYFSSLMFGVLLNDQIISFLTSHYLATGYYSVHRADRHAIQIDDHPHSVLAQISGISTVQTRPSLQVQPSSLAFIERTQSRSLPLGAGLRQQFLAIELHYMTWLRRKIWCTALDTQ
eukprot:scaffold556868_cov34-Prasinocladus_malaysianus.AAC.1